MARLPRVVVPGVPHHITQRGNRRQRVFFSDDDYRLYLALLEEWSIKEGLSIRSFCLMPNHIHIIGVPETEISLHRAVKEVHRRYSCHINLREDWRGFLWQGRFSSFPMDETHFYHALHYVETNPVRAKLVSRPEDWPWSSACYRSCTTPSPFPLNDVPFTMPPSLSVSDAYDKIRQHERTGRPLAGLEFIQELESRCQRSLLPLKPGPKPKKTIIK